MEDRPGSDGVSRAEMKPIHKPSDPFPLSAVSRTDKAMLTHPD
jgi:hypothetical protein